MRKMYGLPPVHGRIDRSEKPSAVWQKRFLVHGRIDRSEKIDYQMR